MGEETHVQSQTLTLIKYHPETTKKKPSLVSSTDSTKSEEEPMIQEGKNNKMPRMRHGAPMTRGQGLKFNFSTVVHHGGNLGP